MAKLNSDVSLIEERRIEKGMSIRIPPEDLKKGRLEFIAACEESDRAERARMAEAIEKISHIYLTF
jgi:hypothetical protein